MIRLRVLETPEEEGDLLFRLISRGRQADVPGYWSVERSNLEEGWVIFTLLDRARAPSFKVAVAGTNIVVSEQDQSLVQQWLGEWGLDFTLGKLIEGQTREEVQAQVSAFQQECTPGTERSRMLEQLGVRLREASDSEARYYRWLGEAQV
jgi:hypothetical protein